MVNETEPTSLLNVEDRVTAALNAMELAHDFVEGFLCSLIRDDRHSRNANTASYAIGQAKEAIQEAYDTFMAYQEQVLRPAAE